MKSREALRVLAEVSEAQWGLVTSAQANARGVSHMNLTRLTEAGDLIRLSHGVYRDAGAPDPQHEHLRAAWLATDPGRLAYERLQEWPPSAVVSGESATRLHGIGDLRALRSEFSTRMRRQSQRSDVRYRTRPLPSNDVTVRDGLPVTTVERTIADLVEDRQDFSIVAGALRDAATQSQLDTGWLAELLSPLAVRNGHRKGDGAALLAELLRIAGIDFEHLARQLNGVPGISARITAIQFERLAETDFRTVPDAAHSELATTVRPIFEQLAGLSVRLQQAIDSARAGGEVDVATLSDADRVARALEAANWTRLASTTRQPAPSAEKRTP